MTNNTDDISILSGNIFNAAMILFFRLDEVAYHYVKLVPQCRKAQSTLRDLMKLPNWFYLRTLTTHWALNGYRIDILIKKHNASKLSRITQPEFRKINLQYICHDVCDQNLSLFVCIEFPAMA